MLKALGVMESFQGICFGHGSSKAYQYVTVEKIKSLGD
jgi:hypothetical protein